MKNEKEERLKKRDYGVAFGDFFNYVAQSATPKFSIFHSQFSIQSKGIFR